MYDGVLCLWLSWNFGCREKDRGNSVLYLLVCSGYMIVPEVGANGDDVFRLYNIS